MATLLFVVGCSNEENLTPNATPRKFTAAFEDAATRTYVDKNFKLLWNADDRLTIFTSTLNEQYKFEGSTGDNSGSFTKITSGDFVTGNTISTNYAVYPYSATTSLSNDEVISLTLPATQNYTENSFGLGANTMVAVTSSADDTFLPFKNLGGYLRLQLYGEGVTVKSIKLQGNNDEVLAGEATVTADYGSLPELTLAEDGTTTITLDCGEGVTLGASADKATIFWLVVPPTTFEGGFAITIADTEGKTMTKSTTNNFSIERNVFKTMNAFAVTTTTPTITAAANEIIYTSTDDAVVTPYATDVFGANITSNVYENGVGVITFDGAITKIGANAFKDCKTLQSITLSNCKTAITRVEVPIENKITIIADSAFMGCVNLTNAVIPESVTEIGVGAFSDCSSLTSISGTPNITKIADAAFANCKNLVEYNIPEGVIEIGSDAFSNCSNLLNISIPNTVTTIKTRAFFNCTKLANINIPNSVSTINNLAFALCSSLTEFCFPNTLATIEDGTLRGCSGLLSISIPNSVTVIGEGAFWDCKKITSIILPTSLTDLGAESFRGCSELQNITIPSNVTSIKDQTFYYCSNLAEVNLSKNLTDIGFGAFRECDHLINIIIPSTVSKIDGYAFADCDKFQTIIIDGGLTNISQLSFSNSPCFKNVYGLSASNDYKSWIPNNCLLFFAPANCTTYTIPEGVTKINMYAFYECRSLVSVTIPSTTSTIEINCFKNCSNLSKLYCKNTTPPQLNSAFSGLSADLKIYVPTTSVNAYKSATNWSEYANCIKAYDFE